MTAEFVAIWIFIFLTTIAIIIFRPILKLAKPLAIAIILELRLLWEHLKEGNHGR